MARARLRVHASPFEAFVILVMRWCGPCSKLVFLSPARVACGIRMRLKFGGGRRVCMALCPMSVHVRVALHDVRWHVYPAPTRNGGAAIPSSVLHPPPPLPPASQSRVGDGLHWGSKGPPSAPLFSPQEEDSNGFGFERTETHYSEFGDVLLSDGGDDEVRLRRAACLSGSVGGGPGISTARCWPNCGSGHVAALGCVSRAVAPPPPSQNESSPLPVTDRQSITRAALCERHGPTLGHSMSVSVPRLGTLRTSLPHAGALCERFCPTLGHSMNVTVPLKEGKDKFLPCIPLFASGVFMYLPLITVHMRTSRVIGVHIICVWHFLQHQFSANVCGRFVRNILAFSNFCPFVCVQVCLLIALHSQV